MKPLMLITGPVATRSGYGSHSRDIVHSLIDMDKFDIKIMSVRWGNTSMNAFSFYDCGIHSGGNTPLRHVSVISYSY